MILFAIIHEPLVKACCLVTFLTLCSAIDSEQVVLRAVRGRDALLPCGQGKVFLDGPESYVIWTKDNKDFIYRYPKDDQNEPVYSFDEEHELPLDQDPTALRLKEVTDRDAGIYLCRVHYLLTPASDYVIELRIVDSPGIPKITNTNGSCISGSVGQVKLGANMTINCEVENADDRPGTLVWWERNGLEVERSTSVEGDVIRTTVHIINATRDELDAHYVCLAQNADVTDPLSASVVIKMNLPPTSVEIRVNQNLDFEAGQPRVVDCVVVGCLPPPTITWHLGEVLLKPTSHRELHEGNFTVSSLTLIPSLRDDKQVLTCRAHNSYLPEDVFTDKIALNVGFRPTCVSDHQEVIGFVSGQTENVNCTVDAYPEPVQFSWTFNNTKTLYTSVKKVAGYEHRYFSSLIWKPKDEDRGDLLCRATNRLGEQKRACVFSIEAGGPPQTPDCETMNTELDIITISCKKSWDGGRKQTIHLELKNDDILLQNVSDMYGHFKLPRLHEKNVTAVLYASNSRGRSAVRIISLTSKTVNAYTDGKHDKTVVDELLPHYVFAILIVLVWISACFLLCSRVKPRRNSRHPSATQSTPEGLLNNTNSDVTIQMGPEFQRMPPLSQDDRSDPEVNLRFPSGCYYGSPINERNVEPAPEPMPRLGLAGEATYYL